MLYIMRTVQYYIACTGFHTGFFSERGPGRRNCLWIWSLGQNHIGSSKVLFQHMRLPNCDGQCSNVDRYIYISFDLVVLIS